MEALITALWDEWLTKSPASSNDATREIAGLLAGLGWQGHREDLGPWTSRRMHVFQRIRLLWPLQASEVKIDLGELLQFSPGKRRKPWITLPSLLGRTLGSVVEQIQRGGDGWWPLVRGLWGAAGSLYLPQNGYFLVLRLPVHSTFRETLAERLADEDCQPSRRIHEGREEFMLRHQQSIAIFLSRIGLDGASLRLDERSLFRSMRDQANRLVNCDSANIRKTLTAAEHQVTLCQKVQFSALMETLDNHLRNLVHVRLLHPSASLRELGQLLSPPVSKSTVEYRWGKLRHLAADLLDGKEDVHVPGKVRREHL